MGRMLRLVAARPHVLVIPTPAATRIRLAVEQQVAARGWVAALTPADADILVVCGTAGGDLEAAAAAVWEQLPGPRARIDIDRVGDLPAALGAATARLSDAAAQRTDAAGRIEARPSRLAAVTDVSTPNQERDGGHDMSAGHGGGHDMEAGHDDRQDIGAGDEDAQDVGSGHGERHPGHGDAHAGPDGMHADHGHGTAMPGGLAMARRGEDRDGLKLDRLHVPVGPVLPDWPAGLVLHTVMQGDVLQAVRPEVLGDAPSGGRPFWDEPALATRDGEPVGWDEWRRRHAAAYLDSVGRFLSVTGWAMAGARARLLRDQLMTGGDLGRARVGLETLHRRVRRSRVLRWLTDGLGHLDARTAHQYGVTGPALRAAGDVTRRVWQWLEEARALLAADGAVYADEGPRGRLDGETLPSHALVHLLPPLLTGLDISTARVVVASFDPDPDELAVPALERVHG